MNLNVLWVLPLVFGVLFWVLLPMFSVEQNRENSANAIRQARREQLAQEIADLELDFGVGRIEAADYAREKQAKMQELGEILQAEGL